MCYIELKNEKYETLEDLKRLLHYILRLDKTAEDSQRANTKQIPWQVVSQR